MTMLDGSSKAKQRKFALTFRRIFEVDAWCVIIWAQVVQYFSGSAVAIGCCTIQKKKIDMYYRRYTTTGPRVTAL